MGYVWTAVVMTKFKTLLPDLLPGRRHENILKDPKAPSYSLLA